MRLMLTKNQIMIAAMAGILFAPSFSYAFGPKGECVAESFSQDPATANAFNDEAAPEVPVVVAAPVVQSLSKSGAWRSDITQPNQSGGYALSSPAREEKLRAAVKSMRRSVLTGGTPVMELFSASKTKEKYLVVTGGYESGIVSKVRFSKLGADGIYRGSLTLPVSGHDGKEKALEWATTDTYTIYMEANGVRQDIVTNVASKDVVTVQEIEVQLKPNEPVRIFYNRSGSAGPHGFLEGRAIDLVWDGSVATTEATPQ